MSSQRVEITDTLEVPVTCKCPSCNTVNQFSIVFPVTGTGILGGSPFGRRERAEKEAEQNLRQNLRYHIEKLYEEDRTAPEKFIRFVNASKCSNCGQDYPWKRIEGATFSASEATVGRGLVGMTASFLFNKKFKQPSKEIKEALRTFPYDMLPHPAMTESELVALKGLNGIESKPDATALFMH